MGTKCSLLFFGKEGGKKKKAQQSALSLLSLSASVTLGGHMAGCGPDPQRGCIPGMATGNVRVEMPNPLVPFSFRTQQQQRRVLLENNSFGGLM